MGKKRLLVAFTYVFGVFAGLVALAIAHSRLKGDDAVGFQIRQSLLSGSLVRIATSMPLALCFLEFGDDPNSATAFLQPLAAPLNRHLLLVVLFAFLAPLLVNALCGIAAWAWTASFRIPGVSLLAEKKGAWYVPLSCIVIAGAWIELAVNYTFFIILLGAVLFTFFYTP
jgi:hypothetical protein